jgi:Cd2+/Zn2+-exporting ATPase
MKRIHIPKTLDKSLPEGVTEMKNKEKEEIFERKWYAHPPLRNVLLAGVFLGIAFGLAYLGIIPSAVEITFYVIAILLGGYYWGREGIEELFEEKEIGIEILMMVATVGSAILGLWDEAAFLVFLYGAAEGVEEYTYARTRGSIRKLLELAPKEACVLRDRREVTIPAEDLKVGDIFIVRPGESVPTDGIIIKGRSSINEAPVTGESIPVEKKEGMKVFAATINQEGALEIKATATFEDNTLSKMIHLVEEAQEQKGKAQLFIEKFGRRYSPLVLLGALLLIVIPPLLGGDPSEWTTRAVVFLVAAAPCALVMSTPVAIAAGIGKAGKNGVLIKGGVHLENLGKIKAVAFDKTGTLTKGKPVVTDIVALNGDEPEVLRLAYSIERLSEHPLARAIVEKAKEFNLEALEATDFEALTGSGVKAKIGDKVIYVGKPKLFEELGLNIQNRPDTEILRNEGKTVILVGTAESIEGILAIRDEIRPQAREVIDNLHCMGIKVIMVTGDNEITAKAIAKELTIDDVRADLKPENKIKIIQELEQEYGAVAMVGDGINDAPALARANAGIAMGTAGTDAAIEAADVALMADDLTKVTYAINLSKRARRISKQNIVFALLVLAVLIPSALIGIMSVAVAVFFHEASELLAVANGLRVARS